MKTAGVAKRRTCVVCTGINGRRRVVQTKDECRRAASLLKKRSAELKRVARQVHALHRLAGKDRTVVCINVATVLSAIGADAYEAAAKLLSASDDLDNPEIAEALRTLQRVAGPSQISN